MTSMNDWSSSTRVANDKSTVSIGSDRRFTGMARSRNEAWPSHTSQSRSSAGSSARGRTVSRKGSRRLAARLGLREKFHFSTGQNERPTEDM